MPIGILAMMVFILTTGFGVDTSGDEGVGAHVFQIWLIIEFLAVAFFAFKWLPKEPKGAFLILGLQIALSLVPVAIVFSLQL